MPELVFSEEMGRYFKSLADANEECYRIAEEARSRGKDPETKVEIPRAEDLASRVEKLLDDYEVAGIAETIRKLTDELGNRELVSLMAAKEMAKRSSGDREKALDTAIRVGLAVLTEGILVAPLEGLADTKIGTNADGSEYVDLIFAGPIRAAGGTGQAMSVLIADVVRTELGIGKYIPTEAEVDRFIEEIPLYKQCQHLQYTPSAHEIQLIVGNCPVCIDGEGTEKMEISGFRDLPRIKTNQVRGGACLVIAEGMCQKASKLQKHVKKLGLEGWEFMDTYLAEKGAGVASKDEEVRTVKKADKYLKDIVAGRPIFGHPCAIGGFRLRYGRARTSGLASLAFNPASMYILGSFPALGTQVKIERPGKACVVTPCDELDGPIVLLTNGDLVQCQTSAEAKALRPNDIAEITDDGEILVPFGEFCENNHYLIPCGYPIEWHRLEMEEKGPLPEDWEHPTWERCKEMARDLGVPMHPDFNLFWSDVELSRLKDLRMHLLGFGTFTDTLELESNPTIKRICEDLGALHKFRDGRIIIDPRYGRPMMECLGLDSDNGRVVSVKELEGGTSLEAVSNAVGMEVRARAMTRIGTRMARPEKAKDRKGAPIIHGLFPITDTTSFKKDLVTAASEMEREKALGHIPSRNIQLDLARRTCPVCGKDTFRCWCRECNKHTVPSLSESRGTIGVDVTAELNAAIADMGVPKPSEVKVLDKLITKARVPEAIEKGILRKYYDLGTYKDGTIRFDMTDIPLTHFRPREIGLSVEKAIELGYTHDMDGNPLTDPEQLCELKVQDFIPNTGCGDYLVSVAKFIDHLLVKFYGMEPFYNVERRDQLIGHLGIGLAPHTSGGILCRIIGYTTASGGFAHPFFHASKRRNCDGDEDSIILLLDGLLNFSRAFLPNRRGGLMDAPLVLTTRLDPNEIDKEAHNVDCLRRYPLEFYRAAMQFKDTKEVEGMMDLIASRIGTERQYEGLGFTHDTNDISEGPKHSAYTTLETMMDKMNAQLELGRKIRAVDECDVATRVIDKHFMPDMAGNLRSFSAQSFRCTKCGEKYRRIPLTGCCTRCGNKLNLTVHELSVRKYLEVSKQISEKYALSDYTKERIMTLEMGMDSLFHNDKVRICKITDFLGGGQQ